MALGIARTEKTKIIFVKSYKDVEFIKDVTKWTEEQIMKVVKKTKK